MRINQLQPISCLDRFGNGMGSTVNGTSDFDNSVFTNDHRVSNPIWPPEIVHAHYVSSISLFVLFGLVSIGKCYYTVRIRSSNGTPRPNWQFLPWFWRIASFGWILNETPSITRLLVVRFEIHPKEAIRQNLREKCIHSWNSNVTLHCEDLLLPLGGVILTL